MDNEDLNHAALIAHRNEFWTRDIEKLLRKWRKQICIRQIGHSKLERMFSKRHAILIVPTIMSTAIVTIGILTTFDNCNNNAVVYDQDTQKYTSVSLPNASATCSSSKWIRLSNGFLSLFTSCLTGIASYLNYSGLANKHGSSYREYNSLIRMIDAILNTPVTLRGDPLGILQNIKNSYDDIAKQAPTLPEEYTVQLEHSIEATPPSSTYNDTPPGSVKNDDVKIHVELPPLECIKEGSPKQSPNFQKELIKNRASLTNVQILDNIHSNGNHSDDDLDNIIYKNEENRFGDTISDLKRLNFELQRLHNEE